MTHAFVGKVKVVWGAYHGDQCTPKIPTLQHWKGHAMNSGLHTPLCDLLGCRYPIVQAGMGGVARSALAAAVSAAGGLGCLGMVRESPELIAREIGLVRGRTDQPFAVNLIPAATEANLFSEELAACRESGVQTLVYFWDVVPEAVAQARAAGMRVLYQVGSLAAAQEAEAAGAAAIIAQGVEAGGHVHGGVSSLVLLPQVAAGVNIPVIGSGGFATGAGLVAALALGAQGIHCGTAFLATQESFAHEIHKQRVVEAECDQTVHTDAYAINWPKGSPVRVLANAMTEELGNRLFGYDPQQIAREEIAEEEGRAIYLWSTDSPLQSMTGDLQRLAFFAGQSTGHVRQIEPAADVVARLVAEARQVLDRMPNPSSDLQPPS
ncbi:MAG: nitronate monooxygenase [Planctomycetales bacterium]|nr:nitronate monooxygenase [Planctomycetales bacterium]